VNSKPQRDIDAALARWRSHPEGAGILLDFDGTLSDIVASPELARPRPKVPDILLALAAAYRLVGVISGRRGEEVRALLRVDGVRVFGLYGLEGGGATGASVQRARREVEIAAREVPGSRLEDKGASLAVHYRGAPNPSRTAAELARRLRSVAERFGLKVLPGKMVLEIAPGETPGKGMVVRREARAAALDRCLYAGDDQADLDAFTALDELERDGLETLKIAVASEETPRELLEAADVVVERPDGLIRLLERLTP
jgi:trehalose 6-phosphate phosphatase